MSGWRTPHNQPFAEYRKDIVMRKAMLVVALATMLGSVQPSSAANLSETFSIQYPAPVYPVPGESVEGENGVISAACLVDGISHDDSRCEKSTYTRLARCLYLQDKATAQDTAARKGLMAAVVEIRAAAVRGSLATDLDNNLFNLVVTNKSQTNVGGTIADLPDVDIAFYASLGDCQGPVQVNAVYINPLEGENPITFRSNPVFQGSYTTYGDEIRRAFPSGVYQDPDDPTKTITAAKYYAIVTIFGGTDANIQFTCLQKTFQSADRQCGSGWFKFL